MSMTMIKFAWSTLMKLVSATIVRFAPISFILVLGQIQRSQTFNVSSLTSIFELILNFNEIIRRRTRKGLKPFSKRLYLKLGHNYY